MNFLPWAFYAVRALEDPSWEKKMELITCGLLCVASKEIVDWSILWRNYSSQDNWQYSLADKGAGLNGFASGREIFFRFDCTESLLALELALGVALALTMTLTATLELALTAALALTATRLLRCKCVPVVPLLQAYFLWVKVNGKLWLVRLVWCLDQCLFNSLLIKVKASLVYCIYGCYWT